MHNIIRKLKVNNRTEAVVAANMLSITSPDQFRRANAKAGHLDLELATTKDGLEITPHPVSPPHVNGEVH